jgi:hypothetical protein
VIERPLEVHIDELLLVGFRGADSERIGTAARRELERLVGEQGTPWPRGGGDLVVLRAGSFRLEPDASPEGVGIEIGRAVYRRLA